MKLEAERAGPGGPGHDELDRVLRPQRLAKADTVNGNQREAGTRELACPLEGQPEVRDSGQDGVSGEMAFEEGASGFEPEASTVALRLLRRLQEGQAFEGRHGRAYYPRLFLPEVLMRASLRRSLTAAIVVLAASSSLRAQDSVNQTFAFETDKWFPLSAAGSSPVILHRIQVVRQQGFFTKSTLFRPGNTEYLASIEIRIEYSNAATRDWKAKLRLALLDDAGREIDGHNGTEDLDEGEKHQIATIKLSTLKYALERARKLRVSAGLQPE